MTALPVMAVNSSSTLTASIRQLAMFAASSWKPAGTDVEAVLGGYISVGKVKVNAETDIIIDDHMGNLDASVADTKILFSMFHNRDLKVGDAFRSNDYNAIVKHVKEVVCCEEC